MILESCQVVERVDALQSTGVDQAHEEIPDIRAVVDLEEQGIFPM